MIDGPAPIEVWYRSAADNTEQPAMLYVPPGGTPVPLLVALHTWVGDYRQDYHQACAEWCIRHGWAFFHPHFRGANNRPEATGSDLVIDDIASGVAYVKNTIPIDASAVFLVGTSGGGYTALLMAGRRPELWAGVSAWVPIVDLRAWHAQQGPYRADIAASCGGPPGLSAAVDEEYRKRSPLTYLAQARTVPLHIHAGIMDGHTGSVPISHALAAFNEVADMTDRLTPGDIGYFVEKAEVPLRLQMAIADESYGGNRPLFRRRSGNAIITIFQGGHELIPAAAMKWLSEQYRRGRNGA